ncbi:MXAN_6577-like cysteine-rich protein [Sorangium sp. So ce1000]|uniref:MXAN_6577-like cysteine-rich protein n=1 Tax=Sorangium sp. So ce1000 TaxID=3133325 RepID=UPI003F5F501D
MSHPGSRASFELSSTVLWLTVASLVALAASCAEGGADAGPCDDGLTRCGGACVDTQADADHCGACDGVCASGERCEAGACVGDGGSGGGGGGGNGAGDEDAASTGGVGGELCAPGRAACNGGCVDLDTDVRHCGGCGRECTAGMLCEGGACRCAAGLTECDGGCVDLESDPLHCGSCEARCAFHETCAEGTCLCGDGLAVCGGRCVDLATDPAHCGACGAACAPGLFCHEGACACAIGGYEDIGSTVPQRLTGTTVGEETYFSLACVAAGSTEAIYKFTAEEAGRYKFDTAGSSYDTAIAVLDFDACAELACNDDRGGADTGSASVVLEEGQSVLLVVSGYNGAQGDFTLHLDRVAPPACPLGTIGAALPRTITGDSWGLGDAVSTRCGSIDTPDAGYSFTAPRAGRYIFDTAGSTYDTVLELRNRSCSGPVIACNDNATDVETSRLIANLTAGQTVVAIVDGIDGGSGPFTLNVTEYKPPPCPEFTLGATFPQTVTGTTAVMDRVSAVPSPCATGGGPEVGYAFTAPIAALYTFDTFGSSFDTVLHVHEGTCTGASLACNDDTSGLQSQVRVMLDEGETVIVVVDGYSTATSGAFKLNVSQTIVPPCPLIDLGSTAPQTVTGTTADAVDILRPSCGAAGAGEVTYSFTAPVAGTYLVDTFGSSFNTVLSALDGSCTGAALACNNDAAGSEQSRLTLELDEGQTVLLLVEGAAAGVSGDFTLTVAPFSGGGTCSTAIDLGSVVPQSVTGSTAEQPESVRPTCGSSNAPDTIYRFTAPENGLYIFNTFGSSFDTVLQILNESCAGTPLACNDNTDGQQSRVTLQLAAGQTVLVVVDGRGTSSGDYVLQVDRFIGPGTCATPISLGSELPLTRTGTTRGQPDAVRPRCSSASTSSCPETVFTYAAPVGGTYVIDTIGSSLDTILHVHTAGCGGAELKCNDDSGGSGTSKMEIELAARQIITVVVDGYDGASGDFTLHIAKR